MGWSRFWELKISNTRNDDHHLFVETKRNFSCFENCAHPSTIQFSKSWPSHLDAPLSRNLRISKSWGPPTRLKISTFLSSKCLHSGLPLRNPGYHYFVIPLSRFLLLKLNRKHPSHIFSQKRWLSTDKQAVSSLTSQLSRLRSRTSGLRVAPSSADCMKRGRRSFAAGVPDKSISFW